jgi:1-deoxy-D-xylulose-5-phosphate reductoisomerase
MPAVLSAANEAAVSLFLDGKIRFCEIAERVAAAMDGFANKPDFTVEDVFSADRDARARVLAAKGVQ